MEAFRADSHEVFKEWDSFSKGFTCKVPLKFQYTPETLKRFIEENTEQSDPLDPDLTNLDEQTLESIANLDRVKWFLNVFGDTIEPIFLRNTNLLFRTANEI